MGFFNRTLWKTLQENKKILLWTVVGVVVLPFILYFTFQLKRSWNYSLGYESRVQGTVCEMVKMEHLTPKGRSICD